MKTNLLGFHVEHGSFARSRMGALRSLGLLGLALAACGDDTAAQDGNLDGSGANGGYGSYGGSGGSGGYGGYGGYGGSGAYGPVGPGGTGGSAGGSYGEGGGAPVPSPISPPPPPEESCEGLDPSSPLVLYVSADDSNSMASPVRAREVVGLGASQVGGVRTHEFFNYYRFDYPAPASTTAALFAEAASGAEAGTIDLQFAVRAKDPLVVRRPMTLTLVLDTSGSMTGSGIARERAAVLALASRLRDGDVVSAVTWSTNQNVLLTNHDVTGPNDPAIVALANGLEANGGTDLNAGLVKGYELATDTFDPQRLNRMVLISDGGANVGITDEELIAEHSELADGEGIYLVGVSTGSFADDVLMDTVTDAGRGAYVYLDSVAEADRILADRFDEVMEVAARGVQIELTVPWYFQMQKFYGEEYSEDPAEVKPQHLAPGDTMVLLQTLKACDPGLVVGTDPISIVARWQTPVTHQDESVSLETTIGELLQGPTPQMPKGKAIAAYADALRSGASADLTAARVAVLAADPSAADADLAEVLSILDAHPNMP